MNSKGKFGLVVMLLILSAQTALAVSPERGQDQSYFKTMYLPEAVDIKVPTLVKVFVPGKQNYPVVVFDETSGQYQPIRSIHQVQENRAILKVVDSSFATGLDGLLDDDFKTSAEFDLDRDEGKAFLVLESDRPFTSHSLTFLTDQFVALPYEVAIFAEVNDELKTVLARTKNTRRSVDFVETTSQKWRIEMWHSQPLRLNELQFSDETSQVKNVGEEIVWLAQSDGKYVVFADAQSYTPIKTGEAGNLYPRNDEVIRELELGEPLVNEFFEEPDFDEDGVIDLLDNCGNIENPLQEDLDKNGLGDACEDHDRDGVLNFKDNCPVDPNRFQEDEDLDGIGDVCDDEESRVTEQLPWLPWAIMGIAAFFIGAMVFHTFREERE